MRRDLNALADREHDLLVIGGGVYGAACAWDAALRGLKVALVEAADFGSGVSWNSLKTIHGGLRYLQTLDLGRMRDSIGERSLWLRLAPELVRPVPFLVPTYGHGFKGREALALGLLLNELVSYDRNEGLRPDRRLPRARLLSPAAVAGLVPGVPRSGLSGGAIYYDAQVQSSERLLLAMLLAAAQQGAALANYAEATALVRVGARIVGARVRDHEGGGELEVRARLTLNATGPGLGKLLELTGVRPVPLPWLRARNLVLRRQIVGQEAVGMLAEGRYLFAVPWNERTLLGTSYDPADADDAGPEAFFEQAQRAFPWAGLVPADIALVHEGLVPGRDAHNLATEPLLLDHAQRDGLKGLISILGVKYTTARLLAEQAMDRACAGIGETGRKSRSAASPLAHARALGGPLAERARTAARDEMALHLDDAVLRRLDLGTAGPPDPADVDVVAAALESELGWSEERRAHERSRWEKR